MLGICRRANHLICGRDSVKASIHAGRARLIIFASDASQRLIDEITNLDTEIEVIITKYTMDALGLATGKRSGVFAIDDKGLKEAVLHKYRED